MKHIVYIVFFIIFSVGIGIVQYSGTPLQGVLPLQKKLEISDSSSQAAKDFFTAAKQQIGVVTSYDFSNGYYGNGGFPPKNTGVCSDVIWRAYKQVGKDIKSQLLDHEQKNQNLYTNFGDTNIAFRRVANLDIFFKNTQASLVTEMIPGDVENLEKWKTGDIVIFARMKSGLMHIGIISDKRRVDGVPYMIDNHGYGTDIRITPLEWGSEIVGHYRVF